jgi:hypothetical protein
MAELSQEQINAKKKLVGIGYSENEADSLVTGSKSVDQILADRRPKNDTGQNNLAADEFGLDLGLMKKSSDNVKKEEDRYKSDYDLIGSDVEYEGFLIPDFKPKFKDIVGSYGIRYDKGAPSEVRAALSYGIKEDAYVIDNAKKVWSEYLIGNKKISKEDFEKYKDELDVSFATVGSGDNEKRILTYRLGKNLGGDNFRYTFNELEGGLFGTGTTTGDFRAIEGEAIPVALSIAGGTIGSGAGPAGTAVGTGLGDALGEYTRLMIGRKVYGLQSNLDDQQFLDYVQSTMIKRGLLSTATAGVFLKVAPAITSLINKAKGEQLSGQALKEFLKSGGELDTALQKELSKAKNILVKNGVPEQQADDYLATNVAKALPSSSQFIKAADEGASLIKGDPSKVLGNALNKQALVAKNAENQVLKSLTGLNKVDDKIADDAIEKLKTRAVNIIDDETTLIDDGIKAANADRMVKLEGMGFEPFVNYIDNFGINISKFTGSVNQRLGRLDRKIEQLAKAKGLKVRINPAEDKELFRVFRDILKKYKFDNKKQFTVQPLIKTKNLKGEALKKALAKNAERQEKNNFLNIFNVPEYANTRVIVESIKKGLADLGEVSYGDATRLVNIVRDASETKYANNPGVQASLRKLANKLQEKLNNPGINGGEIGSLKQQFLNLSTEYRNSYMKQLANNFGYIPTTGGGATTRTALATEGRNIFNKFTDGSAQSITNAKRLRNMIDETNFSNKDQFKGSLLENYYSKVVKVPEGVKPLSHNEFINKFGENYRILLGDDVFNQFQKNVGTATKTFENFVKQKADQVIGVSKALPGFGTNIKDLTPTGIYNKLIQVGDGFDGNALRKALGPGATKDLQTKYLNGMFERTKIQSRLPNVGDVETFNGTALLNYIKNNKDQIMKVFGDKTGKEFIDAHQALGKALELIQAPTTIGKTAGVTEAANKAGLFVDIFAGPLNHKRLVLNRLSRLYDGFDVSGNSLRYLYDYKKFTEVAKKQFLGGNYPRWFDELSPPAKMNFLSKLYEQGAKNIKKGVTFIGKPVTETIEKIPGGGLVTAIPKKIAKTLDPTKAKPIDKTPLVINQYIQDRVIDPMFNEEDEIAGSADIFAPIDIPFQLGNEARKKVSASIGKVLRAWKQKKATRKEIEEKEPEIEKIN